MRGKRAQTASSSPHYEKVIWVKKTTARGSKIAAKVSESPRTPKIRKQTTPLSKKRKMGYSPTPQIGFGVEVDCAPDAPMPAKFKTRSVSSL